MRNKEYNIKHIRMSENHWRKLKKLRKDSGLSWNVFIGEIIKKNGK